MEWPIDCEPGTVIRDTADGVKERHSALCTRVRAHMYARKIPHGNVKATLKIPWMESKKRISTHVRASFVSKHICVASIYQRLRKHEWLDIGLHVIPAITFENANAV